MKIKLLSFLFIAVVISFSIKHNDTANENKLIETGTILKPTASFKNNSASMISKNADTSTVAEAPSLSFEQINSSKETHLTESMTDNTTDVIAKSDNQLNPEDFIADFVNTGKPEAIMEHFAELRRARAELIETQMSAESNDQEWSDDLTQRFQAAEQVVPMISGLNLAVTDCRETICALHFGFDEGTSYQEMEPAMSNIGIVLGTDVWVHHDAAPDGPIVYVARTDLALPELEQVTDL